MGAIASGLNSVAGGGSLISFPTLTVGLGLGEKIANATNSVGLWPGSIAGGLGFANLIEKTGHHLKVLFLPTMLGSIAGAFLLLNTSNETFKRVIPVLIFLASTLLLLQPKVKAMVLKHEKVVPIWLGFVLQFLVSLYGGYFGAGMGIMMLACFSLYMDGNTHELNAVKNWLGLVINFTCSIVFFIKKLVLWQPALVLACGAMVGGYLAARFSQRFNPNKLRFAIAAYGYVMGSFFVWRALVK